MDILFVLLVKVLWFFKFRSQLWNWISHAPWETCDA